METPPCRRPHADRQPTGWNHHHPRPTPIRRCLRRARLAGPSSPALAIRELVDFALTSK